MPTTEAKTTFTRGAVTMQERCSATKADGTPCSGRPWNGGDLCWFHDPAQASERAKGRRLGGSAHSNTNRAKKAALAGALTVEEAGARLGPVLDDVIAQRLPPNVGNAAASIARAIAEIAMVTEIDHRLSELEAALDFAPVRRGA